MDLIEMTRQLGAALQQDERVVKFRETQKVNEEDTALNELIAKLQLCQMQFQQEASKEDKDDAKLQQIDAEYGQIYNQIMASKNMQEYDAAVKEVDKLMKYINGILSLCLQGEDPATCEPHIHEHDCSCG
ncbi:MAG: YlbF family regulator, partial [Clostridia bacterium]|nr:YlbF family regulator [Clostridia bacterium]